MRDLLCPLLAVSASLLIGLPASAEPNEDFFSATVLEPGVLTVSDDLFFASGPAPDTTLGAFDEFGTLIESDDDDSTLGNGVASGLFSIPINSDGSIELAVSGFDDFDFDGIQDGGIDPHFQEGLYDIYIDIFDEDFQIVDGIFDSGELTFGSVDLFSYQDASWIGGLFAVQIDNLVAGGEDPSDVDFFRFTGLDPLLPFTAEITFGDFDSVLGWFDPVTGDLIEVDDDGGVETLSKISGDVSPSGEVVLAVSGFSDFDFLGIHSQLGDYTLELSQEVVAPLDFNGDGSFDNSDLNLLLANWGAVTVPVEWTGFFTAPVDNDELNFLLANWGVGVPVPEPSSAACIALACLAGGSRRRD